MATIAPSGWPGGPARRAPGGVALARVPSGYPVVNPLGKFCGWR